MTEPRRTARAAQKISDLDPRAQAEIMVLGQIRDSLLNLDASVRDVRERVIKIEAKDIDGKLEELKSTITNDRIERERGRDAMAQRISNLELQQAKWQGTFVPIIVAGTGVMTAIISFLMDNVLGKGA